MDAPERDSTAAPLAPRADGAESVDAWLAALASASAAPGGGAAAALCGALAAALVAMVCRVTVAREPSPPLLAATLLGADELRHRLAHLRVEDAGAYTRVVQARRLGAQARGELGDALKRATEVPLRLVQSSRDVLGLCADVVEHVRPSVLGDLGVAAGLAWAALEAGALTARVNLKELTDAGFVRVSETALSHLVVDGQALRQKVLETIATRA